MSGWGSPEAVAAGAAALDAAADAARQAAGLGRSAHTDGWAGQAADKYAEARGAAVRQTSGLEDSYRAAASALHRYAEQMRSARSGYENAAATYESARNAVQANPFDLFAWADAARSRIDAFAAVGQLQSAAAEAAAALRAAAGDQADGNEWWDPFGWFTSDATKPGEQVGKSVMDDDAFDPDDVSQGQIGDCFMLSSIVSLLNTDDGDAFIRKNVRWDDTRNGYWVTLYENGEPTEVFVDKVYGQGARQSDWQWLIFSGDKPSIAALYESALQEKYGYSYLDGGVPADAMEAITGQSVNVMDKGLGSTSFSVLRENLEEGGQVVLSSPRSGDNQITVQSPDGTERQVDIVSSHAYAVTRIDADGNVWVRNPWGPGNSADGGGEFRVSADDAQRLFWRATYTNVTG